MNDWKIRDFLVTVLAIQLAVVCTTGLALFGLDLPIARQVIGFFYLTFVPGTILLRIFKVHNLSRIETLLYSVGLSVALLMLLGFLMNALYPIIGISNPISSLPVLLTISAVVFALSALSYVRDRTFSGTSFLDLKDYFSPVTLVLCSLPFVSVYGAYLMNIKDNNIILLILLSVISTLPILAIFHRFPKKLYPLAIFAIALSLMYHNSLISSYVTGYDIHVELYFANLVKADGFWTSSIPSNINGMLSVVMLPPIFSITCNLSLVWVFKLIYPALFSLATLGLYEVFLRITDERIAFLSCFFFMSVFTFYGEMTALARQEIAELFQVLLMILMIDKSMKTLNKVTFGAIFAFSLITSHYGLSYIFMFSLVIVWLVFLLRRRQISGRGIVNSNAFVFLYCVFALAWYIYTSYSSAFTAIVRIGGNIVSSISEFANPNAVEGLKIITRAATSPLYNVTKILFYVVIFFISVGILALLIRRITIKIEKEYSMFSVVNFALLLGGVTVPFLASSFKTSRLFHVALLFLAPFCIIGSEFIWNILAKKVGRARIIKIDFLKALSLFFAVFFIFNSGLIYAIAGDRPSSISLSNNADFPRFNVKETTAGEWLRARANITVVKDIAGITIGYRPTILAYADIYEALMLQGMLGEHNYLEDYQETKHSIPKDVYFFLGSQNVIDGILTLLGPTEPNTVVLQNSTLFGTLIESNSIYQNGGANVYLPPGN